MLLSKHRYRQLRRIALEDRAEGVAIKHARLKSIPDKVDSVLGYFGMLQDNGSKVDQLDCNVGGAGHRAGAAVRWPGASWSDLQRRSLLRT